MKISGFICFLLFATSINCELLKLRDGEIEGIIGRSKGGRGFRIFYGIPYAEPPIGELRFQAPVPVKPWPGIKNTTTPPPMCVQPNYINFTADFRITGQEDCLYLNIHTPIDPAKESAKAPVIVYIHGGGFQFGDGATYKPDYFMERDIVFVTINYRLGVFGFLSMNNDHISGNFGLKDQSLALHWVRENIAAFGGDQDNITLMGESAGSVSVHFHMFSPLSQGLFHKVIMQSGSAFTSLSYHNGDYAEAVATTVIVSTGCFHRDPVKVLKCLRRIPADALFSISTAIKSGTINPTPIMYQPSIESKVTHGAFLTQKPSTNYLTNVPWLTGINSGEGALVMQDYIKNDGHLFKLANKDKKLVFPEVLDYLMTAEPKDLDNITEKISDFYFGDKELGPGTALKVVELAKMYTDRLFAHPLIKGLQSSRVPRYTYLYDHRGSFSWQQVMTNVTMELGVCHADELPLLFLSEELEAERSTQDKTVSKILLNYWINFATYSDPNGPSREKIWKPVETDGIEYLHIKSDSVTMEKNLIQERYQLWESLPLYKNR